MPNWTNSCSEAEAGFAAAEDPAQLEAARVEFLGAKQGRLKATQKLMGQVDGPDRPAAGKRLNEVKQAIEAAFEAAKQRIEHGGEAIAHAGPPFDVTLPGRRDRRWAVCTRSRRRSKS